MASTGQVPSQAERLEDVAMPGLPLGAENSEKVGHQLAENPPNGSVDTPSNGSEEVVAAKEGSGAEEKPPMAQAPERSKSKTALIMLSLMVSDTETGKFQVLAWLNKALDCCLSCRSRYCKFHSCNQLRFLLTSSRLL